MHSPAVYSDTLAISCLGRAGLKRNRVLFAYSAPEKMSGPFGCSSGSSITNAGARRWMTSRRRRGSANGGRLANGRHAQAVPQKAADGLDELGHRDRLQQIGFTTALADPLLVALHRKSGDRDHWNDLELGVFLEPLGHFETGDFRQLRSLSFAAMALWLVTPARSISSMIGSTLAANCLAFAFTAAVPRFAALASCGPDQHGCVSEPGGSLKQPAVAGIVRALNG